MFPVFLCGISHLYRRVGLHELHKGPMAWIPKSTRDRSSSFVKTLRRYDFQQPAADGRGVNLLEPRHRLPSV